MRLKSLSIHGFRGIPGDLVLDLDADAIVFFGANGNGKTSVLDSMLWALTGVVPRLVESGARTSSDKHIVSRYSNDGEARVELSLDLGEGNTLVINRATTGQAVNQRLSVTDLGGTHQGEPAATILRDTIAPDARFSANASEHVLRALTRSIYLQQDLTRSFVEAESDEEV